MGLDLDWRDGMILQNCEGVIYSTPVVPLGMAVMGCRHEGSGPIRALHIRHSIDTGVLTLPDRIPKPSPHVYLQGAPIDAILFRRQSP